MFLATLNTEIIKYVVIVGSFPLWLPFARALYIELNDALAAEGGLFGRTPSAREVAIIVADPNRSKSPLVNEEFDPHAHGQRGGRAAGTGTAQKNATAPKSRDGAGTTGKIGFAKPRGAHGFARKDQRGG